MHVTFYNTFGIGDAFFLKPLLKHFCEANPTHTFSIFTTYGYSFYKGIPNLLQVEPYEFHQSTYKRHALQKFFHEYHNVTGIIYYANDLFVNTWVAIWNKNIEPENCECYPERLYIAFQKCIQEINHWIQRSYVIPTLEKHQLLYEMPDLDIHLFHEYKKSCGKRLIYFFNRTGYSADTKPFANEAELKNLLDAFSQLYEDSIILVPNKNAIPERKNIIPTSTFGVEETSTCENVLYDTEIAGYCDYAIHFDIGASLTYCNSHFPCYTAKILHCSKIPRYPELLRESLQHCLNVSGETILHVPCSTPVELLNEIQKCIH
jgi:hypothetical protein